MIFRYIYETEANPYHNLAKEQLLLGRVTPGVAFIYLWQNDRAIVVGRNQEVETECRWEEFLQSGGRLARRMSGGGAVFHDMGNLNISLLCNEKDSEVADFNRIITDTLKNFSLEASFNGRNDFLVGDKKISGVAGYTQGNLSCKHGTLMVDCDVKEMIAYLTPNAEKLERNRVRSVEARVGNLKDFSKDISIEALKEAIIKVTAATEFTESINEAELAALSAHYMSREWIFGGRR